MPSDHPWKDERWLPGVLNCEQLGSLIECGLIKNADNKIDSDASALDLHLSGEGYEMFKGSIKPFNRSYSAITKDPFYAKKLTEESDKSFILKKEHCYVFKIKESLHSSIIKNSPFYGQATAKSSIGRIDVIARLIVDGMKEYETFVPNTVGSGEMFLEITPITFDVKVKEGISISQLRFCNGFFESSTIKDKDFINTVLNLGKESNNEGTLSVDISNIKITENVYAAAFCAKDKIETPIELWGQAQYDPSVFWQSVRSSEENNLKSIGIQRNNFYILRSKERLSLPAGVCIYCRAMDETLGEMRIHYAGFVHPLFGSDRKDDREGTPLIFEVRGHNVSVLLTHDEILARLFFYRMSRHSLKIENDESQPYNNQELLLSKFFKKFES